MEILAESYLRPYVPAGIYLAAVVAAGGAMLGLSRILAAPRRTREEPSAPARGGRPPGDTPHAASRAYFLVAVLFALFGVAAVFLASWAVVYRGLGLAGVAGMLTFMGVLVLGFAYAWKRGGLDWD